MSNSIINISISLDKIDKSKIVEKGGKKYLNLTLSKNQQQDQYGNTHSLYHSQSKEERSARANKTFVGNGKEFVFGGNSTTQSAPQQSSANQDVSDLPF